MVASIQDILFTSKEAVFKPPKAIRWEQVQAVVVQSHLLTADLKYPC